MYTVIDNFLPKNNFNEIYEVVMSSNFPWICSYGIATKTNKNEEIYFTHMFFIDDNEANTYVKSNNIYQCNMHIIAPLLERMSIESLIRVKANMYMKTDKLIAHGRHKDCAFKHKGAIFSINTNDGGTILENKEKIKSVKNRMLFFDSSKYHRSTNCTDKACRVNINFNYF